MPSYDFQVGAEFVIRDLLGEAGYLLALAGDQHGAKHGIEDLGGDRSGLEGVDRLPPIGRYFGQFLRRIGSSLDRRRRLPLVADADGAAPRIAAMTR